LENLEEKAGIPAHLESLGVDAQALGLLLTQQIEHDVERHGEVRG